MEYDTIRPPVYKGEFAVAGGVYIKVTKYPQWWHRFWMKVLLGWEFRAFS